MTWASRRQFLYLLGFAALLVLFVGLPAFFFFYNPPSCEDGIQNGLEEGVDCGGGCPVVCSFKVADPLVHWSRLFQIAPGLYTVVALVENTNISFETENLAYTFRLRDSDNLLVYERKGVMVLPPRTTVPVFETGIQTGVRVPARVDFEFLKVPVWEEGSEWKSGVSVVSRELTDTETQPRLSVVVRNTTLETITNLPFVAVLFDVEGNALHASRTVVTSIPGGEDRTLVFTWPQSFGKTVSRIEVTPVPTELP